MMKSNINEATRKVLNLIKYCFKQIELSESLFSVKDTYWSVDKVKWKRLAMLGRAVGELRDFVYLNENTAKIIQKYVGDGLEPFFALRHLHKAKVEGNPRYKWIDATIAAELAIKEFLIRVKPELEPLLLELPSPPLPKLYGQVLESYTNERSPKLNELRKGAETRNRLVHRPKETRIDAQESIKYAQDVEIAIYHLLTLLYPRDSIIRKFSKPRIVLG